MLEGQPEPHQAYLKVLFNGQMSFSPAELETTLRAMGGPLGEATVAGIDMTFADRRPVGTVRFGPHSIGFLGFDEPLEPDEVGICVDRALYDEESKVRIRRHESYLVLNYGESAESIRDQYVALAWVAASMIHLHGSAVVSREGFNSMPLERLYALATSEPGMKAIRKLPLLLLFAGCLRAKTLDGSVWSRTYNLPPFGVPNVATQCAVAETGEAYQLLVSAAENYSSGTEKLKAGLRFEFNGRTYRCRRATENDPMTDEGLDPVLVIERESGRWSTWPLRAGLRLISNLFDRK
jgi:hypothetical protein